MTPDEIETDILNAAREWAFVRSCVTVDKTAHVLKMRLHIAPDCFIQTYTNVEKQLFSYSLVLNRERIYGRDSEGGRWHRHPYGAADSHDFSKSGSTPVTVSEFLLEVQTVLEQEEILLNSSRSQDSFPGSCS